MWLAFLYRFTKLLQVLFFAGMFGSAIVVIITFYEDVKLLFEKDEPPQGTSAPEERPRTVPRENRS